jgi:SNF2 family DNA or RNA helicase
LTGTPIQNYKSDLIALFNFLGFVKDYIKENLEVLVSKYLLRRTKDEVGVHIPRLHKSELFVPQTKEEEELYTELECNNSLVLENESIPLNLEPIVKNIRLRQCTISPKMLYKVLKTEDDNPIYVEWEANISRLEKVIEIARENNKLVIFCEFIDEINYLFNEIKEFGSVTILNGKKKREEKKRILDNLESYDYLIVQIQCGGTGLNLQHFNKSIITGPHYNPMLEEQAIARIHRIGQERETKLYRLYNDDTIDSRIREIQDIKRVLISTYIH